MSTKNDNLATKQDLESLEVKVDERAKEYRDQILNKLDEVMGELENHRIEQNGVKYDITDLQERVTKLEIASKKS